jgi:hypothetical protein
VGCVRPIVIVEAFPHSQHPLEIRIVAIAESLVELVLVGLVRSLDLAVAVT